MCESSLNGRLSVFEGNSSLIGTANIDIEGRRRRFEIRKISSACTTKPIPNFSFLQIN